MSNDTLSKQAIDSGAESLDSASQNQETPVHEQPSAMNPVTTKTRFIDKLPQISINDKLDEMRKQARDPTFIAGRLALAGQITVFYAGPNTGKTLLIMKLIAEASANGTAGNHIYHINLDDTFDGQIAKAELGIRHGFHVVVPSTFPNPRENFAELVHKLVEEGTAGEVVLILDTIKKFTDVMHKKTSSEFMNVCRKLTSSGGSIIVLAHTNKHRDSDNKGIPAGTSDVLDDCDCAYVMDIVEEEPLPDGIKRTVELTQVKSRGPVTQEALYSYIKYDDADYERMFYSVKLVDGSDADQLRAQKALQFEQERDRDLIKEASALLSTSGGMIQRDLVDALTISSEFSRRIVLACLKRWSCPANEGGLWAIKKGDKNSHSYRLN